MSSLDWITVDDVSGYLDLLPTEVNVDNLSRSTAAVKAAVERRRSDLFDKTVDPPSFDPPDDVVNGSVMWAALIYQTRNAPTGFSGYGDEPMLVDSLGSRRAEVMRLIGWRRPGLA